VDIILCAEVYAWKSLLAQFHADYGAAYLEGPGSMSVSILSFFSFLTGFGSCSAFQASIKTAALNWPLHRGTATAFPLAAFGLSAFFFTSISGILFPNSTSSYLLLLTIGTSVMVFLPVFFMWVPHADVYHALATSEEVQPRLHPDSNAMRSWKAGTSPDLKPGKLNVFL
jgi:hypothetical protein